MEKRKQSILEELADASDDLDRAGSQDPRTWAHGRL